MWHFFAKRKRKHHRRKRAVYRKPEHTIKKILAWADEFHAATGRWPSTYSGKIWSAPGETWHGVNRALDAGVRGLPGGSSLARLLAEHRGKRHRLYLPTLTVPQILRWANFHRKRTGRWPTKQSGRIKEAPTEKWLGVDNALRYGKRGLPGGSSLARLLMEKRGVHKPQLVRLSIKQVLAWADDHHRRTGNWPNQNSGRVEQARGETWKGVNLALRNGNRGLPGGTSLARLLAQKRGVQNRSNIPDLTVRQILTWADRHHQATGEWPCFSSGTVLGAPRETWSKIGEALANGYRGFPGGMSLAQLLHEQRGARKQNYLPRLTKSAVPALLGLLEDRELEVAYARQRMGGRDLLSSTLARFGSEAVPGLIEVLKDETKPVFARYQAARSLGKLGRKAKAALPVLEASTKDKRAGVALESACAYVQTGGDSDKVLLLLQSGLKHSSLPVVMMTLETIQRLGPAARKTIPELSGLLQLQHEHPEIRIASAHALSRIGGDARAAVPAISAMLKSANDRERYHATQALERFGPDAKAALPALIEQLKKLEQVSPNPILTIIGNIGSEARPAVPSLVELLRQIDEFVGKDVADTLGRIGPEARAAVPELTAWLAKSRHPSRIAAARALGRIGPDAKAAIPALEKLRSDKSQDVRVWTAFALARISGEVKPQVANMIELWKASTKEDDLGSGFTPFNLAQAFELLGEEAAPARDLLLEAFMDEKTPAGTRRQAARALGHMTQDAVTIIAKAIQLIERPAESHERVLNCTVAAEVLGLLGPRAKAAVPALRRLLDDDENEVVEAAAQSLEKVEGRR